MSSIKQFFTERIPLLRSKQEFERSDILKMIPVRNPLVESTDVDGDVLLKAPVNMKGTAFSWAVRMFKLPPHRQIQLDEIGSCVWNFIDGETSMDTIIRRMMNRTKMSRIEVEKSVGMFLKMLTDRKLIGFRLEDATTHDK